MAHPQAFPGVPLQRTETTSDTATASYTIRSQDSLGVGEFVVECSGLNGNAVAQFVVK